MTRDIKIMPLVWNACSIPQGCAQGEWHIARTIVGLYEINVYHLPAYEGTAFLSVPNSPRSTEHRSVLAAEQSAQKDFDRRILDVIQ